MSNIFTGIVTLGRDAEVRYLQSGVAVLSVTAANSIGFGDKKQTLWITLTVFGKRAEGELVNYLKKGQQCLVSGELTQREYKNQAGETKTQLNLNCSILDLVGGSKSKPTETHQAAKANGYQPQYEEEPDLPF